MRFHSKSFQLVRDAIYARLQLQITTSITSSSLYHEHNMICSSQGIKEPCISHLELFIFSIKAHASQYISTLSLFKMSKMYNQVKTAHNQRICIVSVIRACYVELWNVVFEEKTDNNVQCRKINYVLCTFKNISIKKLFPRFRLRFQFYP